MSQAPDEITRPDAEPGPEYVNPDPSVPDNKVNPDDAPEPGAAFDFPVAAETTLEDAPEALRARAAQADQHWELYLRTRAELDNYRRRATRERQEAVRFAGSALVEKLLPVLDSFEMAMAATQGDTPATVESLRQGISMVQSQLKSVLAEAGVREVDAQGQPFDPNLHEAVAQHESAEVPDGHVLHQLRKGYQLHERLVRPATVVVAKAPGA